MHLGDLREFVDKAELTFDIDGRHYSVAPVDAKTWLRLQAIQAEAEGGEPVTGADANISRVQLGRISLGPVFDQLVEDGIDGPEFQRVMRAAFFWQLGAQDVARVLWADGGKAPAPEQGQESTSTTPTGSTSSASASETRPPASTTATTSPRKSARRSTPRKAAQPV